MFLNECNYIETTNRYFSLSDQTKFSLNGIDKIKDYFKSEIRKRKKKNNE